MLLDGLHIPLTTPFYPDGRIYLRKLEHNAERYSRTPASGLTILGRTGERSLLSDDETRQILSTAIAASATQKVMMANVSRDGVSNTLDLAEFAASQGYDAVFLQLPGVLAGGAANLKLQRIYFQAIADRSSLPIVLEDHASLPIDLLAELSANPTFLGIALYPDRLERLQQVKAATAQAAREVVVTSIFAAVTRRMSAPPEAPAAGNYISAGSLIGGATALATAPPAPAIKTRSKKVGFQILNARTSALLQALEAGAAGSILPFAASAPQAVHEVFAAWKDGDPKLAAEKQTRLLAAAAEIEEKLGVAALKAACDLNGYFGGKPRLPLLPLSGEERSVVEGLLAGMRN